MAVWDYIIVGAGTAGCVLAHELTASGRNRVLLVEAGSKPGLMVKIPAGFPKLFGTARDWAYLTEPQAACDGRIVYAPRGKMLGGSSNMNAQLHQWCHPADFDGWSALGASGWSWNEVAPVFRAMERFTGGTADDQQRGTLGPMIVGRPARPHALAPLFVEAATAAGLGGECDYNGTAYRGAWLTEQANRGGSRFSAYDAYLKPALHRDNLTVLTETPIGGLILEGGRAVGIRTAGPDPQDYRAGAGVILAAGAFGSPHLLMLSGIGPAEHLRAHGIAPVLDLLGVGSDLQEHPLAGLMFRTRRPISMKAAGLGQLLRWLLTRTGMLATSSVDAFAFTNVSGGEAPDLELILGPFEVRDQLREDPHVHAYTIGIVPIAPRSRGTIRLKSPSSTDAPAIDYGLLSDDGGEDARILLAGARLARRIAASEPLAAETAGELDESVSARTDDELLAYLKSMIQTIYHPTSSCRMGVDSGAVVDPQLRLRGVDGLWVVDASVMPTVPRGHPNAVVAMIAKRAAEWIESEPAITAVQIDRAIAPPADGPRPIAT